VKQSAGILLYKIDHNKLYVFLVHPGGPFFAKKDIGAWSIPKGEYDKTEDPLSAAKREFLEETGHTLDGECLPLQTIKQKGGKMVQCWALKGNIDPAKIKSNTFEMEWPPRSGKKQSYPEIDRAAWFAAEEAKTKILLAQQPFISEVQKILGL
jgi:predicted NUDIX family NTP pyrophosphohydrolase